MPRASFIKDFVFAPRRGVRIVYRAGFEYPVTTRCLEDATKSGAVKPANARKTEGDADERR